MIHEEIQQLSTNPRDLRKFSFTVGGVFLLLGGWCLFRHKVAWPWLLLPGGLLLFLGLVAPLSLKRVYLGWMALAFTLGLVVSTTLLTVFFFLVVTPIACLARLCGRDFLSQRMDRQAKSYWLPRDRAQVRKAADYEQQF